MTPDKIAALIALIALVIVAGVTLYKIITLKQKEAGTMHSEEFKHHAAQVARGTAPANTKPIDPLAEAQAILDLLDKAEKAAKGFAWPELIRVMETDDGEEFTLLECPWCGVQLRPGGGLHAVERGERWTYVNDQSDFNQGMVMLWPDSGDFDTEFYAHDFCEKPVALPANFEEDWS